MTIPDDTVLLAAIGSFTTLASQLLSWFVRSRDRKTDASERAVIAQKLEEHSTVMAEKLAENTELTVAAATGATKAYTEANSFNKRLFQIETELKESVEQELSRLSGNIHAIANALTPLVGKVELQPRKQRST